jgi:serine/threonine protein kinase
VLAYSCSSEKFSMPTESSLPPEASELECIAALLPQYEFLELLGQGGMGAVYLARQPSLDRLVAVKVLGALVDADSAFAQQFRLEARSMARLVHPNIVAVFESGQTSIGQLFYVMEYVQGSSLHTLIQRHALPQEQVSGIIAQLCDALQFAHERGVIHRDIKPANILLSDAGQVKVVDFGLALLSGAGGVMEDYGTPDYASPERVSGDAVVDHRADIYSVGAVLHEMLTGMTPAAAALQGQIHTLPEPYAEVVSRCMRGDPERRFHEARALKMAIVAPRSLPAPRVGSYTAGVVPVKSREQVALAAERSSQQTYIRWLWVVVVVLLLALLVLAYLLMQERKVSAVPAVESFIISKPEALFLDEESAAEKPAQ